MNHAIRITLSYDDCSGVIAKWADRCQAAVVYQHDADEEVSKTHVHLALFKCEVKAEALKRMWEDCPGKGNEFWSFKEWKVDDDFLVVVKPNKYITYMTKGYLYASFNKNISKEILEASRLAWVDHDTAAPTKDSTQYFIDEILEKFKYQSSYDYIEHYRHESFLDSNTVMYSMRDYLGFLLSEVRMRTMKVMWSKNRRTPPASLYKTVAGSVFLTLAERFDWMDTAIDVLTQKWY